MTNPERDIPRAHTAPQLGNEPSGIAAWLIRQAQQFEDQHAPQHLTIGLREAAGEIKRLRAALGKPLDTPEGHKLKHDAGLPHLPTQLTYECRLAAGREGPRGYDWEDKPHRVVYDLCRELEARAALAEEKPNDR